ncbi:peptidoglycan-binding domain-containing protein [Ideonella sp. YS5]|uniref:peptidoglycan-binding domain-containing protein n=1 Tax=Ideonella sp. YS5 TaxID=3453714 RepID=UPI003EEEFFA6
MDRLDATPLAALYCKSRRNCPGGQNMPDWFLGAEELRRGRRDVSGSMGQVSGLQAKLRDMQLLQPNEPVTRGLFDAHTELAVRRFQWCAGHVPGALSASGAFVDRPLMPLQVDGVVGERTGRVMQAFSEHGWAPTGLLVRLRIDRLRHTWPNAGFTALLGGHAGIGLCEREFAEVMHAMDAAAQRLGLHIFVNQLFRVECGDDSPAIVRPTSFSSHKIGRGVDLQLGDSATLLAGTNPMDARYMQQAADGTPFAEFRAHAKAALACRYGGDFESIDSPHFDRQILPAGSPTWHMHYYFDQLHYRQALLNADAVPDAA